MRPSRPDRRSGPRGLLIRHGTIVTEGEPWAGDLLCREGRVIALGQRLEHQPGDEVVEASGAAVFPGGVDPHVHLELPVAGTISSDDFASGSAAAVAGGTTSFIDFVHPRRGQNLLEAFAERKQLAARSVIDHALHVAVTSEVLPAGASPARRAAIEREMTRLVEGEGVTSFKVYMAYDVRLGGAELRFVAAVAARLGAVLMVHAEAGEEIERRRSGLTAVAGVPARDSRDASGRPASRAISGPWAHAISRPPRTETRAVEEAIAIARATGVTLYLVHLSCRESVLCVEQARRQGLHVHAETCPQYLLLDESLYARPFEEAVAFVMAPPLRPARHQEALWTAAARGTIDAVGSDHCPFDLLQKTAGRDDFRLIPGGGAGIEHRLALLYTYGVTPGRFDLRRFVALTAARAARLFGLYPRKGTIAVGSDADLVIWDSRIPARLSASTHHHRCDLSLYEGWTVRGLPSVVVAGGQVLYRDGELMTVPGEGRYLPGCVAPDAAG